MDAKKIPVVRVGQGGVRGTPDEFEGHFDRKRRTRKPTQGSSVRPKLKDLANPSMEERLGEYGITE